LTRPLKLRDRCLVVRIQIARVPSPVSIPFHSERRASTRLPTNHILCSAAAATVGRSLFRVGLPSSNVRLGETRLVSVSKVHFHKKASSGPNKTCLVLSRLYPRARSIDRGRLPGGLGTGHHRVLEYGYGPRGKPLGPLHHAE